MSTSVADGTNALPLGLQITHLAFSDLHGGANLAACRLHRALVESNFDSRMLVRLKRGYDPLVQELDTGSRFLERLYRAWRRRQIRNIASRFRLDPQHPAPSLADPRTEWGSSLLRQLPNEGLLHLHWVNRYVDTPSFFKAMGRQHRPLLWTLHDMTPLTGGCSYDFGCGRFSEGCGRCPQIAGESKGDASGRFHRIKLAALAHLAESQLTVIAPNRWMAGQVSRSPMLNRFRCEVISFGVELRDPSSTATPSTQSISPMLRIIAAAVDTNDKRKNLSLLIESIAALPDALRSRIELTLIGQGDPPPDPPCETTTTGYISDPARLASHYAAADLYVHPALEDNQPNTVLEAMAAGTPALVCDTGGVAEMVPPDTNWPLIVPRNDREAMTRALAWWIENRSKATTAGQHCRDHVAKHFTPQKQVERHVKLYQEVGQ